MAGILDTRKTIMLLSLALIAAGTWAGIREASPYFNIGIEDRERFAFLSGNQPLPGPSIASERLVLDNCVQTLTSVYGRLQPAVRKDKAVANCLEAADAITRASPSSSYAWFVGAQMAGMSGDEGGMNDRLLKSQQTGPTEQWIAELRVPLAEDHLSELTAEVRAGHDQDLRMLVASARGIASIAGRYVQQADFRQRITAIVETMPEGDQRRFVSRVEDAARQVTGN